MARVSKHFRLRATQATLDFVDVDVFGDTQLFIDPRAIERLRTDWGAWSLELVREFFSRVLAAVRDGRRRDGMRLLAGLGEPNQTHLGFSEGRARGSGLGRKLAEDLWDALERSRARRSGLLEHLEDTALLIEGVSIDRVSDITTNIIREPLIEYTKLQAARHGMRCEQVGAGAIWDTTSGEWQPEDYDMLPATSTGSLLLVPKIIVRRKLDFDPGEYYRKYILRAMMDQELGAASSSLVRTLKSGRKRVYVRDMRKQVMEQFGSEKKAIIDQTVRDPRLLRNYRRDKERVTNQRQPLALEDFASYVGGRPPNWDRLLTAVTSVRAGRRHATEFHYAAKDLLAALFYPTLIDPVIENEIDQGRKRIDIRFTASGIGRGFVGWLARNYPPLPFVYVECKNYSGDPENPELDQLTGRFNLGRGGNVGLLVARRFDRKRLFIERCRDAAMKNRGYVVPLDDSDLTTLTIARRDDDAATFFRLLSDRFGRLVE